MEQQDGFHPREPDTQTLETFYSHNAQSIHEACGLQSTTRLDRLSTRERQLFSLSQKQTDWKASLRHSGQVQHHVGSGVRYSVFNKVSAQNSICPSYPRPTTEHGVRSRFQSRKSSQESSGLAPRAPTGEDTKHSLAPAVEHSNGGPRIMSKVVRVQTAGVRVNLLRKV